MVITIFWPTVLAAFAYLARKYSLAWKLLLTAAIIPFVIWLMKLLINSDMQPGLIAMFLFLAGLPPATSLLGIFATRNDGTSSTSEVIKTTIAVVLIGLPATLFLLFLLGSDF